MTASMTAGFRTWHDPDGTIGEAAFVLVREGRARLERRDGSRLWVALAELSDDDREWIARKRQQLQLLNQTARAMSTQPQFMPVQLVQTQSAQVPRGKPAERPQQKKVPDEVRPVYAAFEPFAERLKLRWDERYLIVESNGLPDHGMMVGITNWQQQVPLPQNYAGDNAWRIPLHPRLADKPISTRRALYRGAIALAVNGVPIFNALNNRGEDAYEIGELDEWGGHCGRADDYHYHAAPLHLEKIAGKGQPIAYALDGYPIYGLTEADGSPVGKLDEFNGQFDAAGNYHYHATKTYPYINGGLRGVVEVRGDQIEPQPRTIPVRPAGEPLRGAKITAFKAVGDNGYRLTYQVQGKPATIEYTVNADGTYAFEFSEPSGRSRSETFRRRPEDSRRPPGDRPPPPPRRRK